MRPVSDVLRDYLTRPSASGAGLSSEDVDTPEPASPPPTDQGLGRDRCQIGLAGGRACIRGTVGCEVEHPSTSVTTAPSARTALALAEAELRDAEASLATAYRYRGAPGSFIENSDREITGAQVRVSAAAAKLAAAAARVTAG
jgi:hypothetical protein